jgi:hypothetical protein
MSEKADGAVVEVEQQQHAQAATAAAEPKVCSTCAARTVPLAAALRSFARVPPLSCTQRLCYSLSAVRCHD